MPEVYTFTRFSDNSKIFLSDPQRGSSTRDDSGYQFMDVYDSEFLDNRIGMIGYSISSSAHAGWTYDNENIDIHVLLQKLFRVLLPLIKLPISRSEYDSIPNSYFPLIQILSGEGKPSYSESTRTITLFGSSNPQEMIKNTAFSGDLSIHNVARVILYYGLVDSYRSVTGNFEFQSVGLPNIILIDNRRVGRAYHQLVEQNYIRPRGSMNTSGYTTFTELTPEGRDYINNDGLPDGTPQVAPQDNTSNISTLTETYIREDTRSNLISAAEQSYNTVKLSSILLEINDSYSMSNPHAAHALIRALLDHIAPLFGRRNFDQVANNHHWTRTDRRRVNQLQSIFRLDADSVLHEPISNRDTSVDMHSIGLIRTTIDAVLQEAIDQLSSSD